MNGKSMRNLGIVGSVIGAIILIFGLYKYNYAKTMHHASSAFGETNASRIWSGNMANYKIFIIAGAIILAVFLILVIAGIINSANKTVNDAPLTDAQPEISASRKLGELKKMLEENLITREEFEAKKKEIMDKM